jgi:hypothetical protein
VTEWRGSKFSSSSRPLCIIHVSSYGPILWPPQTGILAKVGLNPATRRAHTLTSEEAKLTADRSKTCIL